MKEEEGQGHPTLGDQKIQLNCRPDPEALDAVPVRIGSFVARVTIVDETESTVSSFGTFLLHNSTFFYTMDYTHQWHGL